MKFYKCKQSNTIITKVMNKDGLITECNDMWEEIIPNSVDASAEKHVPVVTIEGNTIKVVVGEIPHPMIPEHYIMWIAIETSSGSQIKYLTPNDSPTAEFVLANGEELVATYAYCNIHGLWVRKTIY